jgi:FixJ family two-component response regulator
MPRLSGEDLAERLRETRPETGVVLMSGFSEMSLLREGRIREGDNFLEKPFTPSALVNVVRQAMSRPHRTRQSSTNST